VDESEYFMNWQKKRERYFLLLSIIAVSLFVATPILFFIYSLNNLVSSFSIIILISTYLMISVCVVIVAGYLVVNKPINEIV